jgi:hypothetical protein
MVIFAWATTQKYFKEIVNHDIRKQIQLEKLNQVDDETLPEMIVEDGRPSGLEFIDGDLWETVDGSPQSGTYDAFIRDMMRNL